jgi:sugar phosphate isomerase/epimerase
MAATIGLSTYSYGPECGARQGMELALRHGFRGFELGSYTLWPAVTPESDARFIRRAAASEGIDVSIHFIHRGVAPASHSRERRDKHLHELEATLHFAERVGARVIVLHPGPVDAPGVEAASAPPEVRRDALSYLIDFIGCVAHLAEETGTVICLENMNQEPGQAARTNGELLTVVKTLDNACVRLTLDFGHADRSVGIAESIGDFAGLVRHVHIHDSDGKKDHQEIGRARVDLASFTPFLARFPHMLLMECVDASDPDGCVVRSRDCLKRLLGDAAR